ncbi:hypothetical protein NB491_00300, partial [Vibrio alginolyticus]|uniref:hypothetical protein n=1 Tax=Vibrio alginolyticus TaxID=663 RepID=UPI00215BE667
NNHTHYERCIDCSARKMTQDVGGFQPINWPWVLGETDNVHLHMNVDYRKSIGFHPPKTK